MNIPTINLARTGTNIVMLRKAAGLTVHDLQMAFGFNSPHVRIDDILITDHSVA